VVIERGANYSDLRRLEYATLKAASCSTGCMNELLRRLVICDRLVQLLLQLERLAQLTNVG
jgi:hypothetical protein